jgi:hypothetical protein
VDEPRDAGLDRLLDLHGQVVVLTEDGDYWVKFDVRRVKVTDARPHGLKYSLTLHGPGNERLVGFDNAHPVPPAEWADPHDHRHFYKSVHPYDYTDSAALLQDFWAATDRVLSERGITP